ncbi:hypothetical protein LAZ67_13002340 [Cordylochernes scorpioides]|uniref:Mos1 transposase HTH domain-containing protein n=1 Tax=Cordylochernes scorpioides TaxID=51811 RepID=A0ABY6L8H0_9ARAC|nr:hypothetical protein LAZ67_13002340 [Cordylochernes scorpioides]
MKDQRIFIKFCVKNGFKGVEIFWMLRTAYGDAFMSRRRVFEGYKRFKEGREETANNESSGRPSTSTTPEKVDKVLGLSRFGPLRRLPFWKPQKKKLKGRKFQSTEEIKVESKKAMKAIPKTDYRRCFADWKKRWLKCIAANGDYFEGDNLSLVFWIVFDFYLLKKMDQRTCIKFCVKNEIKCADAFRMLTVAYGEATLDRSNVYRWYKMFSEGREDVNDEKRAGRPSTSTTDEKINEVEKMILANRRITVREVAEDLNISIGSCHSIFINDLGMRRVAAKFVPKLLNCDQKQHRVNIANEMLDSVRDDPNLLQRVITGDEAWVYGYDVETKAQSSQWKLPHEPRPKKARQVRSNVKVLLTVFFDCRGVVHHEFLPQGRTVNKEYYLQVMRNLREAIRQKRPDLWKNKNWLLHHDNAPAHTSYPKISIFGCWCRWNVMSLEEVGEPCHGSTTTVGSGLAYVFVAGVPQQRAHGRSAGDDSR